MDVSAHLGKTYAFDGFVLDPVERSLVRAGAAVSITPTIFDALLHLLAHAPRVVSKEELLDAVWPDRTVEESNVSQTVFALRRLLANAGSEGPVIATEHGRGYRIAVPVAVHLSMSGASTRGSSSSPVEALSDHAAAPVARRPRGAVLIGLGAAALVVGAGLLAWFRPWVRPRPPAEPSPIVLADFRNATGDAAFDGTLAGALRIDLEQSPVLAVLTQRQVRDTLDLMVKPSDTPLTSDVAAEICTRNNGAGVVNGAIARLGAGYLLTLTAQDCAGQRVLAAEKTEVQSRDAVVPAMDRLTADLRAKLGESALSISRYNTPLMRERTASLDALKAYTTGVELTNHGQAVQAIPVFEHAIALDPNFAMAYAHLASTYYSTRRPSDGARTMTKAFELRQNVNDENRLNIEILYHNQVTRDIEQVIVSARAMTALYPRQFSAWVNLSNALNWLGRYADAIEPARHGVDDAPRLETPYVVLARALQHSGRLDEALAVCAQAAAKGVSGDLMLPLKAEILTAKGDRSGLDALAVSVRGQPAEIGVLAVVAADAYRRGQVRKGDQLYARIAELSKAQGSGNYNLAVQARTLAQLGFRDRARDVLRAASPDDDATDYLLGESEFGDAARARRDLAEALRNGPRDTVLNDATGPEARAYLEFRQGHGQRAVTELMPAARYEARDNEAPYLRGEAYLQVGDGPRAAVEFHKILDHPGVEPMDATHALARLGLARALVRQNNPAAARDAYRQFLAEWNEADQDVPVLIEARSELARLTPSS